MKFLCLPGAYGSAKNFQVQLGPFVTAAENRGITQFKWTQGTNKATPPAGFEDYFGAGPLYRFIDFDGLESFDILEKIRDFPDGVGPEDTMRLLMGDKAPYVVENVQSALQDLLNTIDGDAEIAGVLGYSEGATTAASLILEERRRWQEEGRPRRIKSAIFFAGWPPLLIEEGQAKVLLADECGEVIDVPTLHVVGCNDPYILGAMALYNMCDGDSAELFDHGKGHTVPRDSRTVRELIDAVGRLTAKCAV
ncbi:serine hydrolase FSH [Pseudomassariella vexata]|uniref:Serine hydrolase FSH n=1 Tax=Pseudomassariella vexata TaxID=1141098 RepID=A0A1Y2DWB1_9PEZI|nr:serine hydrolase FSH [Pseudomassariella vexata]ORY63394.1 serine hydrolase FSH [Pseudomassariella vexata]